MALESISCLAYDRGACIEVDGGKWLWRAFRVWLTTEGLVLKFFLRGMVRIVLRAFCVYAVAERNRSNEIGRFFLENQFTL